MDIHGPEAGNLLETSAVLSVDTTTSLACSGLHISFWQSSKVIFYFPDQSGKFFWNFKPLIVEENCVLSI
ncbi:MAG: hypothetical protein GQ542_19700 [Desulforhopalus sp.]|nr:hypothetical protein [Desulforhopalus sp.]